MHAPPVSVIVPCYNQAQFLGAAIDSVRVQDPYAEVVVVDDGSSDNTRQVAMSRPGVRYVRQANRGLAGARNRGLRESAGSLVVFLDADDCLLPGGIAAGVTALAARPDCAMAYGRCVMMGPDGTHWPTPAQPVTICDHHDAFLRQGNLIWMPAAAIFRREALELAGGFHEGFDAAADYDLYLRITRDERIRDHGTLVAAYRQHPLSMSGKASRMLRETLAVMRRHRAEASGPFAAAWREGVHHWQNFYGTKLVEEIREHLRSREVRPALRKTITLAHLAPWVLRGRRRRRRRSSSARRAPRRSARYAGRAMPAAEICAASSRACR